MPSNKWAQLAINALAVAAVVDLGHDVFQTNPYGDVPEFYHYAHIQNTVPGRVIQGTLTLAGAVEVGHGIYNMFMPSKPKKKNENTGVLSDVSVGPYIGTQSLGLTGTF
jgi:hypothetical protein